MAGCWETKVALRRPIFVYKYGVSINFLTNFAQRVFQVAFWKYLLTLAQMPPVYFKKYPDVIYLFKVNNENTRTMCEICSKLTVKTPEWRH